MNVTGLRVGLGEQRGGFGAQKVVIRVYLDGGKEADMVMSPEGAQEVVDDIVSAISAARDQSALMEFMGRVEMTDEVEIPR